MYRAVNPEVKVSAVKNYWKTGNISEISRDLRVSRKAIYQWVGIAEKGLEEIFKEDKPGQRKKISLSEENKRLREQVAKLFLMLHKEGKEVSDTPVVCWKCQSTRLRKNGKVFSRSYGYQQRYLCDNCSFSMYVALKKT